MPHNAQIFASVPYWSSLQLILKLWSVNNLNMNVISMKRFLGGQRYIYFKFCFFMIQDGLVCFTAS